MISSCHLGFHGVRYRCKVPGCPTIFIDPEAAIRRTYGGGTQTAEQSFVTWDRVIREHLAQLHQLRPSLINDYLEADYLA